jgi:hypothetical protein
LSLEAGFGFSHLYHPPTVEGLPAVWGIHRVACEV